MLAMATTHIPSSISRANTQLSLDHHHAPAQRLVACHRRRWCGLQMMQDWLAGFKLDRKALAGLAGNAQAVQAYQDYLQATVQDVVEDLLTLLAPAQDQQGTSCCACMLVATTSCCMPCV